MWLRDFSGWGNRAHEAGMPLAHDGGNPRRPWTVPACKLMYKNPIGKPSFGIMNSSLGATSKSDWIHVTTIDHNKRIRQKSWHTIDAWMSCGIDRWTSKMNVWSKPSRVLSSLWTGRYQDNVIRCERMSIDTYNKHSVSTRAETHRQTQHRLIKHMQTVRWTHNGYPELWCQKHTET